MNAGRSAKTGQIMMSSLWEEVRFRCRNRMRRAGRDPASSGKERRYDLHARNAVMISVPWITFVTGKTKRSSLAKRPSTTDGMDV